MILQVKKLDDEVTLAVKQDVLDSILGDFSAALGVVEARARKESAEEPRDSSPLSPPRPLNLEGLWCGWGDRLCTSPCVRPVFCDAACIGRGRMRRGGSYLPEL